MEDFYNSCKKLKSQGKKWSIIVGYNL
jgi:hypothetical protein